MTLHKRLKRLEKILIPNAVYFITTCTSCRRKFLANDDVAKILFAEWQSSHERHGWLIGRYVIMPDHVHFFCAEDSFVAIKPLAQFMKSWKEWTSKRLSREAGCTFQVWQEGFFDHVLRSNESYADKWLYVRDNPVRAGLVKKWDNWPHQGWIHFDHPRGAGVTDAGYRNKATL